MNILQLARQIYGYRSSCESCDCNEDGTPSWQREMALQQRPAIMNLPNHVAVQFVNPNPNYPYTETAPPPPISPLYANTNNAPRIIPIYPNTAQGPTHGNFVHQSMQQVPMAEAYYINNGNVGGGPGPVPVMAQPVTFQNYSNSAV